jgi:hypothetical protein
MGGGLPSIEGSDSHSETGRSRTHTSSEQCKRTQDEIFWNPRSFHFQTNHTVLPSVWYEVLLKNFSGELCPYKLLGSIVVGE